MDSKTPTQLYLIKWGYETCEGEELEAIYSDLDKAREHIKKQVGKRKLVERIHRKTGQKTGLWSDGDYYIYISKVFMDTPNLYTGD